MLDIQYKILDSRIGNTIAFPDYATPGSAAIDLRAVFNEEKIIIEPQETKLIGTGIAFYIADPNYCGVVLPRSGLGYKHGIVLGNLVGLIDSDYQGELKVPLWNRSQTAYQLSLGERMAQFMIMPVVQGNFLNVQAFHEDSSRGTGGFGHTGAK